MNYTNNGTARMSYDMVRSNLYNAWIKSFNGNPKQCWDYIDSLKLAQHDVRVENTLTANNTNYIFGVIDNQQSTTGIQFRTEQRLKQQDTLICTEFSVYVGLPTSDADIFWERQTYANPVVFAAADAALINGAVFSQGKLKITVNGDVIVPGRQLFANLYKPQTQQTAALGAGSPATEIRGAVDGYVTAEPNLYLIGSKGTIPEIIIPGALVGLGTTQARIGIEFRGFLAQNSTVIS
jgi:hypothetical protein